MITVLGASGFIGSHLVKKLDGISYDYYAPTRDEDLLNKDLGDIIYCIGLTADFRNKPFETVTAHVCKLNDILLNCKFSSLIYLSSTRVYINSKSSVVSESDKLVVDPMNADDLYNLTKLTGERLCLSSGKNVKIVRLSNVVGENDTSNNFLYSIINDVKKNSNLELQQSLVSSKDYIYIDDAVDVIMKIALEGKDVIYNVASGVNTTNEEILNELQKHFLFTYTVAQNPFSIIFPTISNQKISQEFKYNSSNILNKISLIAQKK